MLKKSSLILPLFMFLVGCGGGSSTTVDTTFDQSLSYSEDKRINLLNPNRGFYDADYALEKDVDYNRFSSAFNEGYRLVYAPLNLEEYREIQTLPNSLLTTIEKNFQDANSSGVKLIFRMKYYNEIGGEDADKEIIDGHLTQLTPLFQRYANTISVVQAGIIGPWGEWHSFTGDYSEEDSDYKANRRAIVDRLATIFPKKYIALRTPMHKEELFGKLDVESKEGTSAMITPDIAWSDDIRARVGHHNDCVLATKTDMGTYPSDNIEFWKSYVENDSYYAPVGGETCGIGEGEDAKLSDCDNTLKEFKRLHYAYLNESYHPDVIQKWKDQGCYQTIKENLGYRFVATSLEEKSPIRYRLWLENRGFSSAYSDAPLSFILSNQSDKYKVLTSVDIKKIAAGSRLFIDVDFDKSRIDSGEYCLYVQIGEGNNAIRLSNANLWDENTTSNRLLCGIEVE